MIKTIGIIGGGQLAKMLAIAAQYMGYKVNVLDPNKDCPACGVSNIVIEGNLDDKEKIEELCKISDIITYEFENIPYKIIEELEKKYNIPQGHVPLMISQDRITEKKAVHSVGLRTADFVAVNNLSDLENGMKALGVPCIIKTRSLGYDGHGQKVIRVREDIEDAKVLANKGNCILEKFVNFDYEFSVIAVRSLSNEVSIFPISKNVHVNNILHTSTVPCNFKGALRSRAKHMTTQLMNMLDIHGIMAIEYFAVGDDIVFNEMAPRPHNSGHYSIEGCRTSQFEQAIRAITGLNLGDTTMIQNTVLVNILGQDIDKLDEIQKSEFFQFAKLHMYGKTEARHNRKMGHLTYVGIDEAVIVKEINKYWR